MPPLGDDDLDLVSSATTGNASSFPSASELNLSGLLKAFSAGTSRVGRTWRSEAVFPVVIGSSRTVVERASLA